MWFGADCQPQEQYDLPATNNDTIVEIAFWKSWELFSVNFYQIKIFVFVLRWGEVGKIGLFTEGKDYIFLMAVFSCWCKFYFDCWYLISWNKMKHVRNSSKKLDRVRIIIYYRVKNIFNLDLHLKMMWHSAARMHQH